MKALCVFSGGLDSMLAAQLVRAQDIEVLALFFETPFFRSQGAVASAQRLQLPIKVLDITERHLEMVRRPKHGYGGHMNPCIDCHTLMFRIAGELLEEEEACFVITGEVLGQRPMSQNRNALSLIARECGLQGLLLRPLSAKLLPPTTPEEERWVNRELLMDFRGRSRKPQMELARRMKITDYPSPAGGCVLTETDFSKRLKDLFDSKPEVEIREIELLKLGRHFRIASDAKLIVGRNKKENEAIRALSREKDLLMNAVSVPGPSVLFLGHPSPEVLETARAITASYSDTEGLNSVAVKITGKTGESLSSVGVPDKASFRRYMI